MRIKDVSFIQAYICLYAVDKDGYVWSNWCDWWHIKSHRSKLYGVRSKVSPRAVQKACVRCLRKQGYTDIEVEVIDLEIIGRNGRKAQVEVDWKNRLVGRWHSVDEFMHIHDFSKKYNP